MTATRLTGSPTLYSVTSEKRLRCSKIGCEFETESKKRTAGEPCPVCHNQALASDKVETVGELERCFYQVDLAAFQAVGLCSCERSTMHFRPLLRSTRPDELLAMTETHLDAYRCKHVKSAWREAGKPENVRALLLAMPQQEQDGP